METEMRFYLTHYIPEPLPKEGLRRVSFMTTNTEIFDQKKYCMGFGTHRLFTEKDLALKIEAKSLIALPMPYFQIQKWQGVWIDKDGEIWLGDKSGPLGKKRKKV